MTGWAEYLLAWAVFLTSHSLPIRPQVKTRLVGVLGAGGFTLAYSVLSLTVLIWLIGAAGRAPYIPLWDWASWQVWATRSAMLLACLLVAFAAFLPNPYSFGGWRNHTFDPARPGILALTRHPLLLALAIWAAGHLPVRGDVAHVALFTGFASFAVLGMALINRRKLNSAHSQRFVPSTPVSLPELWVLRTFAGIGLWLGIGALHPILIGPSALPCVIFCG
jgi:uncharacterized membrane protein